MCQCSDMAGADSSNCLGSRVRKNAGVHEATRILANAARSGISFHSARAALMLMIPAIALMTGCGEQKPGNSSEPDIPKGVPTMQLTSTAFKEGETIPASHGNEEQNLSPPLKWSDVPPNVKSFALICDDPDAPRGIWVHWVLFNIPADTRELKSAPGGKVDVPGAAQGKNDFKKLGYGGPAPPSGTHRYYFKLYALDKTLDLKEGATKDEVVKAMNDHIVAQGQLMGKFSAK